jgi:hypothetical protein
MLFSPCWLLVGNEAVVLHTSFLMYSFSCLWIFILSTLEDTEKVCLAPCCMFQQVQEYLHLWDWVFFP